ncbi:MAG TPA: hypothetical protein VF516_42900 [Kofleriaceae bacterium]
MEPIMQRVVHRLVAFAILGATTAGCRLGPLVPDDPGASANVLPKDAVIPGVTSNRDLMNQIILNDSLDTDTLMKNNNVIVRGTTGSATDGTQVKFWAFGNADRAPTPIYVFGTGDPMSASFTPLTDHPPLVETVPGDIDYEPIHTIFNVKVTDKYAGQKITTLGALSDAIDLGLVEAPVAIKVFVNWPIVRPGLRLEVGTGATVPPTPAYAHGYVVDGFPLGGMLGRQPNPRGLLPTSQVSFLREAGTPTFDRAHPIFQATIPTSPPGTSPNYTPVSLVVYVDLVQPLKPTDIHKDSELFTRSASGDIVSADLSKVAQFTVTTKLTDLQIQFAEGAP